MRARPRNVAAALVAAALGGACAANVPLTHPAAVEEQARRGATVEVGRSTRADVHAALGEPWLASRGWGFEAYEAHAERRELAIVSVFTPPFPIGVFRHHVRGLVLTTYDATDTVADVAVGSAPDDDLRGLWIQAGAITVARAAAESRGLQALVDPAALARYLAQRRSSAGCTIALACAPSEDDRWLDESCPDRVSVDDGKPFDLRGVFVSCEGGKCPDGARASGGFARVPVVAPIALAPGAHRLAFASATFQGSSEQRFPCGAGDVIYGVLRGEVKRHWWGPTRSTLAVRAELSEREPPEVAGRRGLLYRDGSWLAEPEPQIER